MELKDQAQNLRKLANNNKNPAPVMDKEPDDPDKYAKNQIVVNSQADLEQSDHDDDLSEKKEVVATRIIAMTSGKGGVGKSTLSVNLAISMAKMGKKVLLFDGDLGLANINVLMGIIPEHNIYEVMKGKKKLKDIIVSTSFGIDIIAGANGISQLANIDETQRNTFMDQLVGLEGYDIMMIDTGAGVGANVIGLVLPADEIVVVTTPEPTAITDAYGMIKSIVVNSADKNINLIVNRVPSAVEAKRVADRLTSISSQFLKTDVKSVGFVFEESLVQKSIRSQRPHVSLYPGSRSSACMNHIAARILNVDIDSISGSGILGFFQNFLNISQEDETIGLF